MLSSLKTFPNIATTELDIAIQPLKKNQCKDPDNIKNKV